MSDIFEMYARNEGLPEICALYAMHGMHDMATPVHAPTFTTFAEPAPELADAEDYLGIDVLRFLDTSELDGGRLRRHQAEGIGIMAQTTRTLCGDPVGAGKTIQAAGTIAYYAQTGLISTDRPVLWLTEGNALAVQTARELQRFLPTLTIRNLVGLKDMTSNRPARWKRALDEPAHIKVMTFSQWLARGHAWEGPLPVVILDEVSALKGGGPRHAAVMQATATADRVHAFTATPYENDPVEVWQIYALLHLWNLPTRESFDHEFVEWKQYPNGAQPWAWASAEAAGRFRTLTAAHYFCRDDAADHLDRPTCVRYPHIWVPLSTDQTMAIQQADRQSNRLRRMQSQQGVITGRDTPSTRAVYAAGLLDATVTADRTAKILLVCEHLRELDTVAAELHRLGIGYVELRGETKQADRSDVIETFRSDPNISVMLGSSVVERGLNLQFCRYLISIGLPDNPARLKQTVGRIVRHGSPFPEVYHWIVLNDHEYDEKAVERLERKEEQAALLGAQTA